MTHSGLPAAAGNDAAGQYRGIDGRQRCRPPSRRHEAGASGFVCKMQVATYPRLRPLTERVRPAKKTARVPVLGSVSSVAKASSSPHGILTSTSVPPPGCDRICKDPPACSPRSVMLIRPTPAGAVRASNPTPLSLILICTLPRAPRRLTEILSARPCLMTLFNASCATARRRPRGLWCVQR